MYFSRLRQIFTPPISSLRPILPTYFFFSQPIVIVYTLFFHLSIFFLSVGNHNVSKQRVIPRTPLPKKLTFWGWDDLLNWKIFEYDGLFENASLYTLLTIVCRMQLSRVEHPKCKAKSFAVDLFKGLQGQGTESLVGVSEGKAL